MSTAIEAAVTIINIYQKSMFFSYGVISSVFYILPLIISTVFYDEVNIKHFAELVVSFLLPLFLTGYFLSPYFGSGQGKLNAFIMCIISLVFASCGLVFFMFFSSPIWGEFSLLRVKIAVSWIFLFILIGLVPAFFASLLFVGDVARGLKKIESMKGS